MEVVTLELATEPDHHLMLSIMLPLPFIDGGFGHLSLAHLPAQV